MILHVDPHSAVPPYEQLRAQVTGLVATGSLAAGTRLPSIRQLAGDLGVAPGTVARAYRELEASGVVVSRGRHGTEVVGPAPSAGAAPHAAHLDEAAAAFAAAAARSGSGVDQAVAAVRRAFDRLHPAATPATTSPAPPVPTPRSAS